MLKHWNFGGVRIALLLTAMTVFAGAVSLQAVEGKLLTKDELKSLVTNAKTAQDHERLAAHYTTQAEELEAEAQIHADEATRLRGSSEPQEVKHNMSNHCTVTATRLRDAAKADRQMAADHTAMAKTAK